MAALMPGEITRKRDSDYHYHILKTREIERRAALEVKRAQQQAQRQAELEQLAWYESLAIGERRRYDQAKADALTRLAQRDRVETAKLHNRLQKQAEANARADYLSESKKNLDTAEVLKQNLQRNTETARRMAAKGSVAAAKISNFLKSQSEKEAQQNKLEESMRGSNWVQARKAAEDLERRRTLQAKRTERMELVREKRRLAAEEAAARQRESTLRSYGLMAMPGI